MPCAICLEEFNKSTRSPTKCPHCSIETCRTCLQTYLLNDINDIPVCINPECGRGYEREFLDGELTRSFRLDTYKHHREKVLADREKARLPGTQEDVHAFMEAKKTYLEKTEKSSELNQRIRELERELSREQTTAYHAKLVLDTYGRLRMPQSNTVSTEPAVQRQAFIKPCPENDCKGFLSTAWKCGLCEKWTCPDCHELKGIHRDTEHTCDPDKVATAKLLEKEAKSCPKCGVQICKIEGCDQMWCTNCNSGFNWRTGKVASGPVHNPHYFEWLRSQGRNPEENRPMNCDQQDDRNIANALRTISTSPETLQDIKYLREVWRLMREAQDPYNIRGEPNHEEIFRILRVRYMSGDMPEDDWKIALQRHEKESHFRNAKNQVKDVFVNASRDLIRQVLQPTHDIPQITTQVKELLKFCNESYDTISKRFNRKAPKYTVKV